MPDKISSPIVLVILDGFGYSEEKKYNAIAQARKPNIDYFLKHYPHTLLKASGTAVGLMPNQIGNSEVGHLTIGSGRIIKQDVVRINEAIENGSFFNNPVLLRVLKKVSSSDNRLHLMGLISDGGVHSYEKHTFALIKEAQQHNISNLFIHAFLDGRDVPPKSAITYLKKLDEICREYQLGIIATLHGRLYAMDRDHNWERTEKSYNVLTEPQKLLFSSWQEALDFYYKEGITDEYIPPTQLLHSGIIKDHDSVIFFNFRPDRARQLTAAFTDSSFDKFPRKKINFTEFVTMTDYNHQKYKTSVLFSRNVINNTFKEILEKNNKTIFSIAETEKYAHVTYFFNGGKEEKLPHETRVLIPSIVVKNYIDFPQMSAQEITNTVLQSLEKDPKNFYLINYANPDMVGHSGSLQATTQAIECIDYELGRLYKAVVQDMNGVLYITADHGNAEDMFDEKNMQPKTSHTNNPVYFIMIKRNIEKSYLKNYQLEGLSDIAPFILKQMNLPIAKEMRRNND
ncbi:MAG: 2,3-bisphosphoglycerate-independent phosphoglycerate mutase [Candidatus Babeliales bacterium]